MTKVFILRLDRCADGYPEDQSSSTIGVFSTLEKAKWEAQNYHNNNDYEYLKLIFNTDNIAEFSDSYNIHEYVISGYIIDKVNYYRFCNFSK